MDECVGSMHRAQCGFVSGLAGNRLHYLRPPVYTVSEAPLSVSLYHALMQQHRAACYKSSAELSREVCRKGENVSGTLRHLI